MNNDNRYDDPFDDTVNPPTATDAADTSEDTADTSEDTADTSEDTAAADSDAQTEPSGSWLGRKLRSVKGDPALWTILITLLCVSMLTVYSSQLGSGYDPANNQYTDKNIQSIVVAIVASLVVAVATSAVPCSWLRAVTPLFYVGSLILTLCTYTPLGHEINGATRWVKLFGVVFQPSELLKVATMMMLALQLTVYQPVINSVNLLPLDRRRWRRVGVWFREMPLGKALRHVWHHPTLRIMGPVLASIAAVFFSHNSSAFIIAAMSFLMFFFARIKWYELGKLLTVALFLMFVALSFGLGRGETAASRGSGFIEMWKNPAMCHADGTYKSPNQLNDTENAIIAIHDGGIAGRGAGRSMLRSRLTHPESDYIFAFFTEEYGIIMAFIIILLYFWIFSRSLTIFENSEWLYGGMLAIGAATLITIQAMMPIMVTVNFFPETGQNMPLVAHGLTSMICMAITFGIILSVSRQVNGGTLRPDPASIIADSAPEDEDGDDGADDE